MTKELLARIHSESFRQQVQDLLVELCAVDTTPHPDVSVMGRRESEVFDILERELRSCGFSNARMERRPINPEIRRHRAFSQLHFTKTQERPEGLDPDEAYAGRSNLLFFVEGGETSGEGADLAVNAHIDVVAPYFPPRVEDGVVHGRGACDDKGAVAAMVAALRALADHLSEKRLRLNRRLTAMFVIEEETGGNGSLSLAVDRELNERFDTLLVLEACDNQLYPANRGAVWYQLDLPPVGLSQFETAAFVIEQLEIEGRALRAESRHPLFPQRPVQTCHGIMDRWGEHPSRICGRIDFRIDLGAPPDDRTENLVRDCLESALAEYIGLYGDKTRAIDAATGRAKVDHHYDLRRDDRGFEIAVHGATGHMGAILENDGAITKMATMVRSLVWSRAKIESLAGSPVTLELARRSGDPVLKLEGGQGFTPTHSIDEVMERVVRAAERGAEFYRRIVGRPAPGESAVRGSFDKLHNAAFDGDPDGPAMRRAIEAARQCGLWRPGQPITGWTVSCDARLFATERPDLPVITTGPGKLEYAHSDQEQLRMDDLIQCPEFVALYILKETGTA